MYPAFSLPGDPYLAIGATKDMLESAMRTILFREVSPTLKSWIFLH